MLRVNISLIYVSATSYGGRSCALPYSISYSGGSDISYILVLRNQRNYSSAFGKSLKKISCILLKSTTGMLSAKIFVL